MFEATNIEPLVIYRKKRDPQRRINTIKGTGKACMGVQKSTVPIFSTMIPKRALLIVQEIVLHQEYQVD